MAEPASDLRRQLRTLVEERARGDLRERDFQRRQTELGVALYRAVAAERLAPGEDIVAEHHVVHSHFRATESLLRDPEQALVSFFATARRLIRVRGTLRPGHPVSGDDEDGTVVDELPCDRIRQVTRRHERRWGEAGVGLGFALLALLLGEALSVTGPMLVLAGLLGVAHGLLLPTRWAEVETLDGQPEPPFTVFGLGRRSARTLLAAIRDGMASGRQTSGETP